MTDQLPAHLASRQRPAMLKEAISGLNLGRGPHVSIADNRFTLVDGAGNEKPMQTLYIDLVVVDVNPHVSRMYYDPSKPYNPADSTPPLCFSDNGIGASAQAQTPLNNNCQLCDKSSWSSAVSRVTGKGIPACAQSKKLAVIAGGMGELVFQLKVPPASLTNWLAYCKILAQRGLEPYDVYTRVEFESQGVLKFSPAPIGDKGLCYVHEAVVALTEKLWATKATDDATNKNDVPWGGQADAQKLAYAQQQAPAQIAPQPMAPPPQPFGQAANNMAAQGFVPPQQNVGLQSHAAAFGGQQAAPATPFGATPAVAAANHGFGAPTPAPTAATISPSSPFGGAAQAGTSSPTDATPAPARRPRGPNKPKADAAPAVDDGVPPFLRRNPDNTMPATPAPNPTQFGMQQNPAAPDAGVQAALDAAFRLPT